MNSMTEASFSLRWCSVHVLTILRWPKGTKISDFIFWAYRKIKSEIFQKISDFIFSTCKKIKSEILPKISDFIFLTVLINELITLFTLISKIS